jgi:hypothetical protein
MFANTGITPAQPPAIQLELQRLEKVSAEISEMVAVLENRLSCVMRDPETSQIRAEPNPVEAISPIVSILRQRRLETESLAYRLGVILDRLDI